MAKKRSARSISVDGLRQSVIEGWFQKSGTKAQYDQQPLEAAAMIGACVEAYECTQNKEWTAVGYHVFQLVPRQERSTDPIFTTMPAVDAAMGLSTTGVNENQGAESTLSYILSSTCWLLQWSARSHGECIAKMRNRRLAGDSAD